MVKNLIVGGDSSVSLLKRSSVKLMIWCDIHQDQTSFGRSKLGQVPWTSISIIWHDTNPQESIFRSRFKLYAGTPFMSVWPPYAQPLPWLESQFNESGSQSLDGNVDRKTLTKMFKSPRSPSSARRSSFWCSAATPPGPRGRQTCRRQRQQPEQSFDFSQNSNIFLTCPIVWPRRGGLPGPQT